jgi:hypothetical protein
LLVTDPARSRSRRRGFKIYAPDWLLSFVSVACVGPGDLSKLRRTGNNAPTAQTRLGDVAYRFESAYPVQAAKPINFTTGKYWTE